MSSSVRLACATLAVTIVGLTAPVTAVRQQLSGDRVLPDFDVREGQSPRAPSPQTEAELRRASGSARSRVRVHPFTGGVRVLEWPGINVARTIPAQALRTVVASLAERLGLEDGDLGSLTLIRDYVTRANGIRTVSFAQNVDSVPVFDAIVTVHIDGDGQVVLITSSAGRTAARRRTAQITVEQAVRAAVANIRPELPFAPVRTADATGAARFARGQLRRDPIGSLTWLPVDGVLRLAWQVNVEPDSDSEAYDVLVDAVTGEVLLRRNRVYFAEGSGRVMQSASMQVLDPRRLDPTPIGQPGSSCPPPSNYMVRSLTAAFRDPATTLFDTGRLSGNNAHVFRGDTSDEGALGTFDGTKWNFDFPFNSPDSAETALFAALNFAHDFFYDLGFDEAAGNFQQDNFSRGGLGGDPVNGNARALGRNNANFRNAPDGSSPTINMFLWDGTGCWAEDVDLDSAPDLDGDYDLDILLHEYHHGVSLRLNHAFTGAEAGAMGEGGGDFFAYSVDGNTLLAEYARPGGLRSVNSKTYADWTCQGFACEVHDNGEIWANALWDVRERFRNDRVRGNESAGVNEAHQLYIDALKLSPPGPTMLDMRNAMLTDDALRNPAGARSANFCRLWESFAGRGMGLAAVDTADHGSNSVVADFTVPDGCVASPPPVPVVTVSVDVATANEAGAVAAVIRLSRSEVSAEPLTIQYSTAGTALAGTDYVTPPTSATIPAGAADVVVPIVPIDDTLVEPNETVSLTLRSGGPYIIGTPSSGTVTIVSDDVAPDLTVSSFTVPVQGAAGGVIQVTDTTNNVGTAPASASNTTYYLSANAVLDATDPIVGSRSVPLLSAGTSNTGTAPVTLPEALAPGTYTLFAKADGPGAIGESNEFNNARLAFIRVGADLAVTALTGPATAGAGSTIVVSDTTANQGVDTAPASITRFYLSADFNLDASDAPLQNRAVPILGGGASSTVSTSVIIPASTPDSTYYLIAKCDASGVVAESNETNNTRSMLLRIGADLTVSAATAPARVAGPTSIDVTETTQNVGAAGSSASVTGFYLSTNTLLDVSDIRVGSRAVPALSPGASSTSTTSVTLPALSAGTWYLIVNADDERTITETVETNNTRSVALLVGPDLTVAAFTLPFTVTAGSTVTMSDSVKNVGAAEAGASVIRYYLSTNAAFDAEDQLLGSRSVPALAPGVISTATSSITIPGDLSGACYIFAVADSTSVVPEASETNNMAVRFVVVTK